eukprot:g1718.t1
MGEARVRFRRLDDAEDEEDGKEDKNFFADMLSARGRPVFLAGGGEAAAAARGASSGSRKGKSTGTLQNASTYAVSPDGKDMSQLFKMHNLYRCLHNVPPLVWSDDLAKNSHAFSKTPQCEKSLCDFAHSGDNTATDWVSTNIAGVTADQAYWREGKKAGDKIANTEDKFTSDFTYIGESIAYGIYLGDPAKNWHAVKWWYEDEIELLPAWKNSGNPTLTGPNWTVDGNPDSVQPPDLPDGSGGLASGTKVAAWFDETANHGGLDFAARNYGFIDHADASWGHYTQVVWRSTSEIGCAANWEHSNVICMYGEGGNGNNQFDDNVFNVAKPVHECTDFGENVFLLEGSFAVTVLAAGPAGQMSGASMDKTTNEQGRLILLSALRRSLLPKIQDKVNAKLFPNGTEDVADLQLIVLGDYNMLYPFDDSGPKAYAHYGDDSAVLGKDIPTDATRGAYWKRLKVEARFRVRGISPERAECLRGGKLATILQEVLAELRTECATFDETAAQAYCGSQCVGQGGEYCGLKVADPYTALGNMAFCVPSAAASSLLQVHEHGRGRGEVASSGSSSSSSSASAASSGTADYSTLPQCDDGIAAALRGFGLSVANLCASAAAKSCTLDECLVEQPTQCMLPEWEGSDHYMSAYLQDLALSDAFPMTVKPPLADGAITPAACVAGPAPQAESAEQGREKQSELGHAQLDEDNDSTTVLDADTDSVSFLGGELRDEPGAGREREALESSLVKESAGDEEEKVVGLAAVLNVTDFYPAPTSPGSSVMRASSGEVVDLAEAAKFMSVSPLPNRMPWPGLWQKAFPIQCKQPEWLLRADSLLLAVSPEKRASSVRATAVVSVLQPEAGPNWGSSSTRPKWLLALLAATLQHLRRFGHGLILRTEFTPQEDAHLQGWEKRHCASQNKTEAACTKEFERDNFTWEKYLMLSDYLSLHLEPELGESYADANEGGQEKNRSTGQETQYRFTHVSVLDADAGFVNFHVDSIGLLAGLFTDTFSAHVRGNENTETPWKTEGIVAECSSNEQTCLNTLMYGRKAVMQQHVLLGSSMWWNRGRRPQSPHVPEPDGRLHLMHYMGSGGGREQADADICNGLMFPQAVGESARKILGVCNYSEHDGGAISPKGLLVRTATADYRSFLGPEQNERCLGPVGSGRSPAVGGKHPCLDVARCAAAAPTSPSFTTSRPGPRKYAFAFSFFGKKLADPGGDDFNSLFPNLQSVELVRKNILAADRARAKIASPHDAVAEIDIVVLAAPTVNEKKYEATTFRDWYDHETALPREKDGDGGEVGVLQSKKMAESMSTDELYLALAQRKLAKYSYELAKSVGERGREEVGKIKLALAPWTLPPNMKFNGDDDAGYKSNGGGWCGEQDFIRLNVMNLTQYDAVIYYDNDVEVQDTSGESLSQLLRCVDRHDLITFTSSGTGGALNGGFFSLKPKAQLLRAAIKFAEVATYTAETGWGNAGFAPGHGAFEGFECGQGFWLTLFYHLGSKEVVDAYKNAGWTESQIMEELRPVQLDRCVWNYQHNAFGQCEQLKSQCDGVVAHHKPVKYYELSEDAKSGRALTDLDRKAIRHGEAGSGDCLKRGIQVLKLQQSAVAGERRSILVHSNLDKHPATAQATFNVFYFVEKAQSDQFPNTWPLNVESWLLHLRTKTIRPKVVQLNDANVIDYIPDLPSDFDSLPYGQAKSDFVRYAVCIKRNSPGHTLMIMDSDVVFQKPLDSEVPERIVSGGVELFSYETGAQNCVGDAKVNGGAPSFSSNIMGASRGSSYMRRVWEKQKHAVTDHCKTASEFKSDEKVCCPAASDELFDESGHRITECCKKMKPCLIK